MKVYLITEAQMNLLHQRLELSALRASNFLTNHDPKRFENDDLFRTFNMVIRTWQDEVGKS